MMFPTNLFCILLCSSLVQLVSAGNGKCPPSFDCGNLGKIHFPFTDVEHPDCGMVMIHGCNDRYPDAVKTIKNNGTWFYVVDIHSDQSTIVIRDEGLHALLLSRDCGTFSKNHTFETTSPFFSFILSTVNLFRCNRTLNVNPPQTFSKYTTCPDDIFYYTESMTNKHSNSDYYYQRYYQFFPACSIVQLPFGGPSFQPIPNANLFDIVSAEKIPIEVQLSPACSSCYYLRGGQCQLDTQGKFLCAKGTCVYIEKLEKQS